MLPLIQRVHTFKTVMKTSSDVSLEVEAWRQRAEEPFLKDLLNHLSSAVTILKYVRVVCLFVFHVSDPSYLV